MVLLQMFFCSVLSLPKEKNVVSKCVNRVRQVRLFEVRRNVVPLTVWQPVAAPALLSGRPKVRGARGQVYMVVNNALPQCGTHVTPLFQVTFPSPFPLISLFSLLPVVSFLSTCLSFPSPAPPLLWYSYLEERCKLPQRVRAEPGRQMQFGEFWA